METVELKEMIGKKIVDIVKNEDEIIFIDDKGTQYIFNHIQGCCEEVHLKDICGDLDDLKNSTIYVAQKVQSDNFSSKYEESETWTFYIFRTMKGTVTISWQGSSNGYYSESVDFSIKNKGE